MRHIFSCPLCLIYKWFLESAMKRHSNSTWHQRCHHRTGTNMYTLSSVHLCFLSSVLLLHHSLFYSLFSCPGSKAAPRPGGIGSAAAGQPGMEGDSMLSKILPGGAAEQAGKLGDGTTNKSLESSTFQTSDLMKDLPWKNISYYYWLSPC